MITFAHHFQVQRAVEVAKTENSRAGWKKKIDFEGGNKSFNKSDCLTSDLEIKFKPLNSISIIS